MKQRVFIFLLIAGVAAYSCTNKVYETNGETIYKTGKNLQGERLLDRKASRIKIVNSCQTCHGKNGERIKRASIRFSDLANSNNRFTPYNDSLFFRFLDEDLKSNGAKANIGVLWKMSDKDKQDLLHYLKSL